jgi:hypothetical protein
LLVLGGLSAMKEVFSSFVIYILQNFITYSQHLQVAITISIINFLWTICYTEKVELRTPPAQMKYKVNNVVSSGAIDIEETKTPVTKNTWTNKLQKISKRNNIKAVCIVLLLTVTQQFSGNLMILQYLP